MVWGAPRHRLLGGPGGAKDPHGVHALPARAAGGQAPDQVTHFIPVLPLLCWDQATSHPRTLGHPSLKWRSHHSCSSQAVGCVRMRAPHKSQHHYFYKEGKQYWNGVKNAIRRPWMWIFLLWDWCVKEGGSTKQWSVIKARVEWGVLWVRGCAAGTPQQPLNPAQQDSPRKLREAPAKHSSHLRAADCSTARFLSVLKWV